MPYFRLLAVPAAALLLTLAACRNAPNDQALTNDIKARLYSDAATKPANINVAVQGGIATLSGDTPSSDVALEAMKVANSTPGIKGVKDQLTVNGAPDTQQSAANANPPANATSTAPPTATAPQPTGSDSYPPLPTSTGPAAQPQPAPPAQSAQAPPPPPQPVTVTIPAGVHVSVRLIDPIDSAHNTAGQVFRATLAEPLLSHGRVLLPRGTPVSVLLANARSAGRIKGRAELEVRLSAIEYHGHTYPVDSSIYEEQGNARGKQTAERTGIGAAAGAIIGAIAGGGKGAAIGSAAGGGAGFGVNVFTHGQQVKIPSEALLTFTLRRRLTIQP